MSMIKPTTTTQWNSLDGARALSILSVLACHLLPLGPKTFFDLNIALGQFGMAIFLGLSGFLIAHKLITDKSLVDFFVKRAVRIFPLLWLILLLSFAWRLSDLGFNAVIAHVFLFVNNLPHYYFPETEHLWSLCVEIHFYILAGLFFFIFKRSGLILLVLTGLLLSVYRFKEQALFDTTTLFRLDELLIGLSIGLLWHTESPAANWLKKTLGSLSPFFLMAALALASLAPPNPWLFVLRPYIAALLIGALIYNQGSSLTKLMASKKWEWVSRHSYALYLIHPFLLVTWLGSGDKLTIYMKRPLLFLVLFVLAYLSTKYFEKYFIQTGKKWLEKRNIAKSKTAVLSHPSTAD
jgi:peptidoglycan/LPS O-acetylase OafA/YrhL